VAARRIECSSKAAHDGPKRITHVGGFNPDGSPWRLALEDAIREIEADRRTYYCDVGGQSYLIVVDKNGAGAKFIKAVIDGSEPDSLLKLPDCS
jgi:hypothetical protein